MLNSTLPCGYVRALFEFAVSRGARRDMLIEHSGVQPADFADEDARVPLAKCAALMEAAVSLCNDPAFALRFGMAIRTEDISVALLIAGASETVAQARLNMNRYARLVRDDNPGDDNPGPGSDLLTLVRDKHGVWLEFRRDPFSDTPYFTEVGFAWCVRETRRMLEARGETMAFPKAIHFVHGEPGYRAEYDRIFQVPLTFGSDRNAMLVDEAFLALSMPGANPYIAKLLTRHAEVLLKRLESDRTMRGRVESLLLSSLPDGQLTIAPVARKLGLSRQTLFRKLKTEGVAFEQILDGLRREMAFHYLGQERLSVSEASHLLGFSEPAAFSRAFKRWTGLSPVAWTRRLSTE